MKVKEYSDRITGMSRIAEKVPGWVDRLLIPTLESKVREIVKEQVGHLEKIMETRFEAVNARIDSLEKTFSARIDSLEQRLPLVQELAEIKVRLAEVEKRTATR
jgi:hypothetical protein